MPTSAGLQDSRRFDSGSELVAFMRDETYENVAKYAGRMWELGFCSMGALDVAAELDEAAIHSLFDAEGHDHAGVSELLAHAHSMRGVLTGLRNFYCSPIFSPNEHQTCMHDGNA